MYHVSQFCVTQYKEARGVLPEPSIKNSFLINGTTGNVLGLKTCMPEIVSDLAVKYKIYPLCLTVCNTRMRGNISVYISNTHTNTHTHKTIILCTLRI